MGTFRENKPISVKRILQVCWDDYKASHTVTGYQLKEVEKALSCYDSSKGCFVYYCKTCDKYVFKTMGCNSRICSSCGKRYTDQWSTSLSQAMFPVPHRHFVLSVSDVLWPYLRDWNLLKSYMDAAIHCFNDYFSRRLHRDVQVGVIVILHPFGKDMKWYPHLHLILTEGGFDKGRNFIPMTFIPADAFRRKWQYEVLHVLKRAGVPGDVIHRLFVEHPKGFYVWLHRRGRIIHPKVIAKYVGRYVRHPAIANSRITYFDGKVVRFFFVAGENDTERRVEVVMTAEQFITALIQHIPPPQFRMIRYYGAYGRRIKRLYGGKVRSAVKQLNLFKFGLERVTRCPFCGSVMEFVWYCRKPPPEPQKIQRELLDWVSVSLPSVCHRRRLSCKARMCTNNRKFYMVCALTSSYGIH